MADGDSGGHDIAVGRPWRLWWGPDRCRRGPLLDIEFVDHIAGETCCLDLHNHNDSRELALDTDRTDAGAGRRKC
jgi:hypothetical protein